MKILHVDRQGHGFDLKEIEQMEDKALSPIQRALVEVTKEDLLQRMVIDEARHALEMIAWNTSKDPRITAAGALRAIERLMPTKTERSYGANPPMPD